jgi:hypothetical protein
MRRPIKTLVLAALALGLSAAAAAAAGHMTIRLNENRRLVLHGSASTVVVGDPTVADVAMSDAHSVIVLGKGYGTTQLVVTDHAGHTLLAEDITVVEPDSGRVTFYRGVKESDYACDGGRCHALPDVKVGTGGSGSGAPNPMSDTAQTVVPHS